ncbi:N(4)-acetylcytidine aminohydrolase [Ursidibacter sp. B-7004-1]
MNKITFFSRFEADIVAGKKTITIRDKSESYFLPNQQLNVFTLETDRLFAKICVKSVTPITFEDLNDLHAKQENMSLDELKHIIRTIYPNEDHFFVIEFELIDEPL